MKFCAFVVTSASEMFSSRRSRITHSVLAETPVSFAAILASLRGERTAERSPELRAGKSSAISFSRIAFGKSDTTC